MTEKTKMKFAPDFNPTDLQVLLKKNDKEVIASYYSDFRGRKAFHIRTLFTSDGEIWAPGKGLSVPAEQADNLRKAIAANTFGGRA